MQRQKDQNIIINHTDMRFWNLYLIVLCSLLFSCSRQVAEPRAQLGDAEVTVRLHPVEGSKKWPESLEVFVVRPSFLEDVEDNQINTFLQIMKDDLSTMNENQLTMLKGFIKLLKDFNC